MFEEMFCGLSDVIPTEAPLAARAPDKIKVFFDVFYLKNEK